MININDKLVKFESIVFVKRQIKNKVKKLKVK